MHLHDSNAWWFGEGKGVVVVDEVIVKQNCIQRGASLTIMNTLHSVHCIRYYNNAVRILSYRLLKFYSVKSIWVMDFLSWYSYVEFFSTSSVLNDLRSMMRKWNQQLSIINNTITKWKMAILKPRCKRDIIYVSL